MCATVSYIKNQRYEQSLISQKYCDKFWFVMHDEFQGKAHKGLMSWKQNVNSLQ